MSYHKVVQGDWVYYIRHELVHCLTADTTALYYLQMSDFAVDKSTNTLVKCRYPLEEVMDKFLDTSTGIPS
jgi:hypothetical protein